MGRGIPMLPGAGRSPPVPFLAKRDTPFPPPTGLPGGAGGRLLDEVAGPPDGRGEGAGGRPAPLPQLRHRRPGPGLCSRHRDPRDGRPHPGPGQPAAFIWAPALRPPGTPLSSWRPLRLPTHSLILASPPPGPRDHPRLPRAARRGGGPGGSGPRVRSFR